MRQYRFGECIAESIKVYNKLKKQGKNPKFIEGYAEVNDYDGILEPDEDFMNIFYPKLLKQIKNGSDYPRVLPHTWIECEGKIIDKTKNQFDIYNGVICYYENCRYYFRGRARVDLMDIEIGAGAEFEENLKIHYPTGV